MAALRQILLSPVRRSSAAASITMATIISFLLMPIKATEERKPPPCVLGLLPMKAVSSPVA